MRLSLLVLIYMVKYILEYYALDARIFELKNQGKGALYMEQRDIETLLKSVKDGSISIDDAVLKLKEAPFDDMGFARTDLHRGLRQGKAEVIYGQGKTPEQILKISENLLSHGQKNVLITRMSAEAADYYKEKMSGDYDFSYDELCKIAIAGQQIDPEVLEGKIVVATGGTSDIPIAEEAAKTAEIMGNKVIRLYDVGVAGIHRLLEKNTMEHIMTANAIIAIAGMEGALASVIGGLADCPVIAVPTSVGYGASFGGLSALLSMLNSCASGVSVVNIDNGFGAGYLAGMINQKH